MIPNINSAPLQIKVIRVTKDQMVDTCVGTKFSLKKWIKSIGRDEFGSFNFDIANGYYQIFAPTLIEKDSEFQLLEIAVINLERRMLLFNNLPISPNDPTVKLVRFNLTSPEFEYEEIA